MAKRIAHTKDPSGTGIDNNKEFVYEVCIYKHISNGCFLISSKFLKTIKPLPIKQSCNITYYDKYFIEKSIISV